MLAALVCTLATATPCEKLKALPKAAACEQKRGHVLRALELMERHLEKKPKDKRARKLVQRWRGGLVTFDVFSEPEGVEVTADGVARGVAPLTLELDPGPHAFRYAHEGFVTLERTEDAPGGAHAKVTAVLEAVPDAGPEPEALAPLASVAPEPPVELVRPAPAPAPAPPASHLKQYVLGATGLAFAVGGGVLVLTSVLQREPDIPSRNRLWTGAGVAGLGGALTIAAIVWLLFETRPGAAR